MLGELARRRNDDARADRWLAEARQEIDARAQSVPAADLRGEFKALGERLTRDPLAAHR